MRFVRIGFHIEKLRVIADVVHAFPASDSHHELTGDRTRGMVLAEDGPLRYITSGYGEE